MRPVIVLTSIIVVTAVSIAALWSFKRPGTLLVEAPPKLTNVSLRLKGPFGPTCAGEMVAFRSGLFQGVGLNLVLEPGGADADPITSVVSGADTFGVVRGDRFLVARSKGAPIVAFAAGYLESPVGFYVLEKSGIHTPQDFIGKRVVRLAGQDTALIYDAMLAHLHISRSQIREAAKGADISELINGNVDVWPGHVGREAYALQQRGISFNVIYPSNYGIHVPGTVYFTSEKVIRDNPSLVQKFLNAVIAGWNMTYADYSKSVQLISAFDEKLLPPDRVLFELKAERDTILPLGRRFAEFDETQWKMLRTILINARLIHDEDSVDLSRAVAYDFLKEAYRKPISFGK
jgi:ABC-type nitrate/sulfonate/bicarbonate transport system substrate-binding protein